MERGNENSIFFTWKEGAKSSWVACTDREVCSCEKAKNRFEFLPAQHAAGWNVQHLIPANGSFLQQSHCHGKRSCSNGRFLNSSYRLFSNFVQEHSWSYLQISQYLAKLAIKDNWKAEAWIFLSCSLLSALCSPKSAIERTLFCFVSFFCCCLSTY